MGGDGGALLLLLAWAVGGHTLAGLPTPATLSGLGEVATRTVDAFRAAIVPVPSTPELVLLAAAGTWVCAAVADGLARRRQAGLLSVVPLVVVHAFVATLGTPRCARGRRPCGAPSWSATWLSPTIFPPRCGRWPVAS